MRVDLQDRSPEVTVGTHEARNLVARGDWAPSIKFPFGSLAEMNPEIALWISSGIIRDLGKPRARDHDRGTGQEAVLQRLNRRFIGSVTHPGIVTVNN